MMLLFAKLDCLHLVHSSKLFKQFKIIYFSFLSSGQESGERVWPFPCDDDFSEDLKSDIADILQVGQL